MSMRALTLAAVSFVIVASVSTWAFSERSDAPVALAMEPEHGFGPVPLDVAQAEGVDRPTWSAGQAWELLFPLSEFTCILAVTEVRDDGYGRGFSCDGDRMAAAEVAVFGLDMLRDASLDLDATTRDGSEIRFFEWPLRDGATWETSWMGRELTVRSTLVAEMEGPSGIEPGFRIVMYDVDYAFATYDYLPSLGMWSRFAFTEGIHVEVVSQIDDWDSTVVSAQAQERLVYDSEQGFQLPPFTFVSPESDHALHLQRVSDGFFAGSVSLRTPSGSVAWQDTAGLRGGASSEQRLLDGEPGTWTLDTATVSVGYRVVIHGIEYQTWDSILGR